MNWRRVSRREAWDRLVKAGPPDWVLRHARAVEGLADAMAGQALEQGVDVDRGLVCAGALLHDVGRAVTQDVRHASIGAAMLRDEQWPPPLVHVVERHTGGGITAEEAEALGLPVQDYTPVTWEERLVAAADNLFSGDRRLWLADVQVKYEARGLHQAWARIESLHTDLCRRLDSDLERLAPARLPAP